MTRSEFRSLSRGDVVRFRSLDLVVEAAYFRVFGKKSVFHILVKPEGDLPTANLTEFAAKNLSVVSIKPERVLTPYSVAA